MKIAILSLIAAVGIGAAGFYQFERNQAFEKKTERSLNNLTQKLDALHQTNDSFRPEIDELKSNVQGIKQEQTWKISQVMYLVQLANERLTIAHDVQTSLRLLETADKELQSLQNPKLTPIRENILQDVHSLRSVKLPDQEGLWLTVTELLEEVPSLPTRGNRHEFTEDTTEVTTVPLTSTPTWRDHFSSTLDNLKTLVQIKRHDKPIEPMLEEAEQTLAVQRLQLLLEQVRFGLLQGNAAVYQKSIQAALQWIDKYFETSDDKVKNLQDALKALAQVDLNPKLPNLGKSLELLNNFKKETQG